MNCLVIGAGLSGAVCARQMAESGKSVLVLERRPQVAGNLFDQTDEHGCLIHEYGPHAFHTNDKEVYDYICRFEDWKPYRLECGAVLAEKYSPSPFNFTTIDLFYPEQEAAALKQSLQEAFPDQKTAPITELLESEREDIKAFARFLFKHDYAPYTAKQWGLSADQIDPSVLKRVPFCLSYREGYFDDTYQVMPVHSYLDFIRNMLDHPNIEVRTNVDGQKRLAFKNQQLYYQDKAVDFPVIYTGAADELFDFCYGRLPYRSLRFEHEWVDVESFQNAAIVAYPEEKGFTRITEYTKLPPQETCGTSIIKEFPLPYKPGEEAEPFYPVLTEESQKQAAAYQKLAEDTKWLTLCGRLANFKYYNMDQAIKNALETSRRLFIEEVK